MKRISAALLIGVWASACATLGNLRDGKLRGLTNGNLGDARDVLVGVQSDLAPIADLLQELTPENEYYVGRTVAVSILDKFEYRYRSSDYPAASSGAPSELREASLTEYVNQIGLVLANAALERADRKGDRPAPLAGWHFVVVESDLVNAFAAPGGFIFVTTGTLKSAQSEDELACVLAHEVAHVVKGHALGQVQRARWANVPSKWLKSSANLPPEHKAALEKMFEGTVGDILDALLVKGYSRDTEYEADGLGAHIARAAGYDPSALIRFLTAVRDRGEGGAGGARASHGSPSERIERLHALPAVARAEGDPPPSRARRFAAATRPLR